MNNIYLKHLFDQIVLKNEEYKTLNSTITHYSKRLDEIYLKMLNDNGIDQSITFATNDKSNIAAIVSTPNTLLMDEHKELLDRLYRTLTLKTHPDKSGDKDDFINIKKLYDEENFFELLMYCDKYYLCDNFDSLPIHMLHFVLEKSLHDTERKILKLKSTIGYQLLFGNIDHYIQSLKHEKQIIDEYTKKNAELKQQNEMLKTLNKESGNV